MKSQLGYLSSQDGHEECPVILTAPMGSRLNLTIFNFLKPKERSACYEVATVKDGATQKTLHVCENNERTKTVHVSSSSTVEITFSKSPELNQLGSFLIHYQGR